MAIWHTTGCLLCAQNCGLEVLVEDNRIVKVRGDKRNPRSQGYCCHKGTKLGHHVQHSGRLTRPLKRTSRGFERISWEQAISEIAERLRAIVEQHGPRAVAYVGGGGQGSHFEAAFGLTLLHALGSRYHYSPLGQELTGYFWTCGRMLGRQNRFAIPDEARADMLLAVGWNGMQSHQMPRAPLVLREFARNDGKLLAVIDPRQSETARLANIHLPVRPGADALLTRAMLAILLAEGWENRRYLEEHVEGFSRIGPWLRRLDVRAALEVCQLGYEPVRDLCRLLAERRWCMHADLGVLMNRHSTATSYLQMLLLAACGRLCVPGGNVVPGSLVPLGSHSDERRPGAWRTAATGFPAIAGVFPPSVLPEEVLSEHPERLRAVLTSNANPLRSYADTGAYERAFGELELSVTIDIAMSETALASHYVLPARSGLESWDGTLFPWSFPEIYFQLRRPVLEPEGLPLEAGEIHSRLADRLGLVPAIPPWLDRAAARGRLPFTLALARFFALHPKAARVAPFIMAKTLGRHMGSAHLAAVWGMLVSTRGRVLSNARRAGLGPDSPLSAHTLERTLAAVVRERSLGPLGLLVPRLSQADKIFTALVDHPEGIWVGALDPEQNWRELGTPHQRIAAEIPELRAELESIEPEAERRALEPTSAYPFILNAGRHGATNANTLMRDPAWLGPKRGCTLAMSPEDAAKLGLRDGELALVTTEAGEAEVEVEVTADARPGQVLIPHGFGLVHEGKERGVNVNRLTPARHRDPIAATPLHRFLPCRIERAQPLKDA